MPKRD